MFYKISDHVFFTFWFYDGIPFFKNNFRLCLGTSISFQIVNFNYEITNEKFEKDKVREVILKFSILTNFNTMVELIQIQI